MSATTAAIAPCSSHLPPSRNRPASRSILAFRPTLACRSHSSTCSPSSSSFVFGEKLIFAVRNQCFLGSPSISRPFSPVMEWQDCTVKMEIDVPISVAYKCYSQRESIPQWMPFISTVKVLDDKPDLSRWSLKYKAFGQDLEYSWLARNMQPILNQKIHWRSLEGLPNRGAVRFYPKSASSCLVEVGMPVLLVFLSDFSFPSSSSLHIS
ncbi:hypothetical protein SAY86_016613 [Trapa natans]|uniref:Coenzyme Q-binding protein COQ10 START domain-containing protein n=1 Tax=Trapa natans TaxID=22666 RepID=A0AAN7LKG0_TRANT|nr:hypothetical protein SAY86_016613 [Trapa natans]